jgi:hypothetical protein
MSLSAHGAVVCWTFQRSGVPFVEASGRGNNPGYVTIVQFSELGKPIGKIRVPRVVKSDAE